MNIEHLDFHITNKCNMLCKHCLFSSGEKDMEELTYNEIKQVLIDFADISNSKGSVNLFGGEPLLRKDIFEIIKLSDELGLNVGITTNANFEESTIEKLKEFKNLLVKVDLDGGNAKTHDWLRNKKGHFDNIIKIIKNYKKSDLKVNVTTVLHKKNVNEIEIILNLCNELNINAIMFFYFTPLGRGNEIKEIQLEADEWIAARDRVIYWIRHYKPSFNIIWENSFYTQSESDNYKDYKICNKLLSSINIMSNGNVHYCGLLGSVNALPLGNIRKDSLKTIIESSKFKNYKKFNGCPALAIQDKNIKKNEQLKDPRKTTNNIFQSCSYICKLLNEYEVEKLTDTKVLM
ncbi:radical SAM protein [Cellulosilyticum sp. I15G10I2]|uniref:radical SAM protein n=1 Tax=Cellulosilyticum sp. I15G10I2 TaxID=1892843 RepID=UPI00085C2A0E|nr:radical SAM protein [Cellulosilyticum sp. I15G10I2]